MADGTIVFETKADTAQLKADYRQAKAEIKSLESEIKKAQGYSDALRKSLSESPNDKKTQTSLDKNEGYLAQLRNEWDALNGKVTEYENNVNSSTQRVANRVAASARKAGATIASSPVRSSG